MTFITWACLRCEQELATILGPQNPTQRSCEVYLNPCYFVATFSLQTLCNDGHIVTCDEIGLVTVVTGHGVPSVPGVA